MTKRGKQASRKAAARKIGFLEVPLRDGPGNSDSPLNVHLAQREPCRARQTEVQVSVGKGGEESCTEIQPRPGRPWLRSRVIKHWPN